MNLIDSSKNGNGSLPTSTIESSDTAATQREPESPESGVETPPRFATRADVKTPEGIGKSKLLLLVGGLAVAVLFFVFTAVVGKSPKKAAVKQVVQAQQAKQQASTPPKGSVTPLMDTPHAPAPDNNGGQLGPSDIRRTRSVGSPLDVKPIAAKPISGGTLGTVPSFAQTQQKWEDPAPYAAPPAPVETVQSQQNSLKEPSLIFVRNQTQSQAGTAIKASTDDDGAPRLELTPGTRIQAKLETQISSAVLAPVVAVVEYTYAIGEKVIIPAGARVYGALQQADRSGLVSVKFDEVELIDGAREKIDAVGTGLDLGPIKGNVHGKNTGKNFLVRAASGLGSVLAEVAGNNTSAAFSEDDMLRERLAENIGTAGDSEVMSLNANTRIVVSVPADTKIYVVFTKHEQTPSTLHKITTSNQ
jgi:type IV secretory pathway VirB10-like protein